jgi:hypothetical protein
MTTTRTGLAAVIAALALPAGTAGAAGKIEFNRDIRPILAENCFACHGPDSASRQADLRLDRREVALSTGAIAPGKPDESKLIRRVFSADPAEVMPPPSSRKKLTDAEKESLRRWILDGAEYQPHWSLIPPARPPLPPVRNAAWPRNPIDRFILARLEAAGLEPAPEADRRTLARRLSLDVTGLPPAPAEVEAFVADPAPDAYERLLDRLLESPHWGEHRGRYWLDAARYADTHGIHFDNFREMWSYRDWVIDAFNRNLPFDRFTTEQLAGDLLETPGIDQRVASGFNRCNMTTNEGGVIPEEYIVHYTRDRTETVSQVWLGLTAGCAVCHDHKFDPLSQREFYEMAAFFNNTTQGAMDGNIKDTPPVIPLPVPGERGRWEAVKAEIAKGREKLESRKLSARPDFEKWLSRTALAGGAAVPQGGSPGSPASDAGAVVPADGLRLHAPLSEGKGTTARILVDGRSIEAPLPAEAAWEAGHAAPHALRHGPGAAIEVPDAGDFEKDQAFSFGAWIRLPKDGVTGSALARMDEEDGHRGWDLWLERGSVASHLVHRWDGDALKVVSRKKLEAGKWTHVLVTHDGSGKAAGLKIYVDGRAADTTSQVNRLKGTIRTKVPLKIGQRHRTAQVDGVAIQDVRIYDRALSPEDVERLAAGTRAAHIAAKAADERTAAEVEELFAFWLAAVDPDYREARGRLRALEDEKSAIESRGTVAHVMQERGEAPGAFILFRGEYDKRRDPVAADTPDVLPPWPAGLARNRLGFARWLLLPEQPLTARVTVNRFWQEVFGTGIVRTAGDFGVSGELPSHPELLDWLAVELRESGWDVKKLFKLMLTSAAYRQSAAVTPAKLEKDAQNRLLSRGPRFRMDAEMIRDGALASSGLLIPTIGGPSVKPYQPDGVWEAVAMMESNTRYYKRDSGENLYRRSLYTFWKRAAPPASMDIFNAPNREICTVRRERTNTPLQALVTLNDIQFVEAARRLAETALRDGAGDPSPDPAPADAREAGIQLMAARLLARPFGDEELAVARASLGDLLDHYRAHPAEAKELISVGESKADPSLDPVPLAAWTMLANQLMNLDEVLNK